MDELERFEQNILRERILCEDNCQKVVVGDLEIFYNKETKTAIFRDNGEINFKLNDIATETGIFVSSLHVAMDECKKESLIEEGIDFRQLSEEEGEQYSKLLGLKKLSVRPNIFSIHSLMTAMIVGRMPGWENALKWLKNRSHVLEKLENKLNKTDVKFTEYIDVAYSEIAKILETPKRRSNYLKETYKSEDYLESSTRTIVKTKPLIDKKQSCNLTNEELKMVNEVFEERHIKALAKRFHKMLYNK